MDRYVETRDSLASFSHTAITHISTSFGQFSLPERLSIFSSLICNETNNNKGNDGDTSEDTQTDREHFELPPRYFFFLRAFLSLCSWVGGNGG